MPIIPNIRLLIYPTLEAAFFMLAVYWLDKSIMLAALLLLLASIFLSYALHVTFHEIMHRTGLKPANRWFSYAITVFTGVPFDGYRIHHMAHHRYNNNFRDYSSTWRLAAGKLERRNIILYGFTWPRHPLHVHRSMRFKHRRKYVTEGLLRRVSEQKFIVPLMMLALAFYSPWASLLYAALIYFGWSCTTFHNYIQHPPVRTEHTQSIYNRLYNYVSSNNGLHWEHHNAPGIPWYALQPKPQRLSV